VLEVVEDHDNSTYRAVHTIRFSNGVYVLHKKSRKGIETPKADRDMIEARLLQAQKHSEGV